MDPWKTRTDLIPGYAFDKKDRKLIHKVWRSLLAALAGHGFVSLDTSGSLGHYALIGLARLSKKFANVLRDHGSNALLSYVKKGADECRSTALAVEDLPRSNIFKRHLRGRLHCM